MSALLTIIILAFNSEMATSNYRLKKDCLKESYDIIHNNYINF
jgi:hypothetical protein